MKENESTSTSVHENNNQQTDAERMSEVLKAFSPLQLLSEEQRKALGTRYNKTWLTPRISKVEALQKKHIIGFFDAAFTLSLLEDADNLIVGKKVARTADTMYNLSSELFGTEENRTAALHQIQTAFDGVEVIHQQAVGKRFRTLVLKGFTSKMGIRILEQVCEKLDVREGEWI